MARKSHLSVTDELERAVLNMNVVDTCVALPLPSIGRTASSRAPFSHLIYHVSYKDRMRLGLRGASSNSSICFNPTTSAWKLDPEC